MNTPYRNEKELVGCSLNNRRLFQRDNLLSQRITYDRPEQYGMSEEVLDFINRRFQTDCDWLTGNCYYFAVILLARFPQGSIYYDIIDGHFVFGYQGLYYDWTGITDYAKDNLVEWNKFDEYDILRKERIIRDCIL